MEEKCKKAKWLSDEALQISVKRREVKSKGEKPLRGLEGVPFLPGAPQEEAGLTKTKSYTREKVTGTEHKLTRTWIRGRMSQLGLP